MRNLVSKAVFGALTLAAVALGGCSAATDTEPGEGAAGVVETETGALGQACSSDAECESGSCADGVCCTTACDGECQACNLPGQLGICAPHAAGSDPDAECAAPACFEGMQESFACNGAGACDVSVKSCGAYACGVAACNDSCKSDDDCAEGARCSRGACFSE
ncbi:MAG: hypothetical protein R3B13_02395 [Polyangiaceae bacterium]